MTRPLIDVLRILIASLTGLTIGLAAYICWSYARTAADMAPDPRRWAPLQVAGFALSHCMYASYGALRIIERIGATAVTFETPFVLMASSLSVSVLLLAAFKERQRQRAFRRAKSQGRVPCRRAEDT